MTRPRRRPLDGNRAPLLVGWLFADLLLVLFLAALASLPAPPASATPNAGASASATPTPKPTPRVLEQTPHTINVNVAPSRIRNPATRAAAERTLLSELQQQLSAQGLRGRQAGFVLVFAYGPIDGINTAVDTANTVLGLIKAKAGGFNQISGLGYWTGSGNFVFKIFFFV